MSKQIQLKNGTDKVYPNPFFPVGAIYMSVTSTNPSTYFGGTWVAWGQGRVPVGVNTSGTFNTPEKTGGTETHTLSLSELPTTTYTDSPVDTLVTVSSSSGVWWLNNRGGGNQPHNNLQPYITCYMWKRTA